MSRDILGETKLSVRKDGGWYLALDVGNGTTKNACQYQNKFGEKSQSMSGIVTTVEYNRVYIIVYILFLIHILDMLNVNEIIIHPQLIEHSIYAWMRMRDTIYNIH